MSSYPREGDPEIGKQCTFAVTCQGCGSSIEVGNQRLHQIPLRMALQGLVRRRPRGPNYSTLSALWKIGMGSVRA